MPRAAIPRARLIQALGVDVSDDRLRELLWATKAELDGVDGGSLAIECTADRLDLLTEGGLALALGPKVGSARGGLAVAPGSWSGSAPELIVDPSVDPIRPHIAGVVLQAPAGHPLDAGLLDEAIRFQELLHATYGGNRRRASLGIYPTARFRFPVRYSLRPADEVRFVPLDGTAEVPARAFLSTHPMAAAYGALGTSDGRVLALEDADGVVLSLPPILNSRSAGEARPGDTSLLLESTGTTAARVRESVGLLSLVFVAQGWCAVPVAVRAPHGTDDGRAVLAPRRVGLSLRTLDALAGRTYTLPETEQLLSECRLTGHPVSGGFSVDVPAWRPDILTEVDVAEDVVLARGVRAEEGVVPPSPVRGRRLPEAVFRRHIAELLVGLGYTEVYTPLLVSTEVDALIAPSYAIALANPVSDLFSHLRNRLLPSLLTSLARNVRHAYPQRFFEGGPVVVRDPSVETGGRTVYRAGAVIAGERASFADGAALLDALTTAVAALGVREPVELPGTIPGRAARLRLAGESIGEVGELHPSVLTALRIPVSAVWAELDLSALWPLARRGGEGS
jgi:phenylalanyl-tRNA synthetase beta chain